MRTRRVGVSELLASEVVLGTWGLTEGAYGPGSAAEFEPTVRAAIEAGVTTFDTSPLWGDGESERVVAHVARELKAPPVLITRAGVRREGGRVARDFAKAAIEASVHGSLARTKLDVLDVVLIHGAREAELRSAGAMESLLGLKHAGKIRVVGASVESVGAARLALKQGAEALAVPASALGMRTVAELAADLSHAKSALFARSPLNFGVLAGQWGEEHQFPELDHRRDRWERRVLRERIRQVEALRPLAQETGRSLAELAIRYLLENRLVTAAMVGARTPAQIRAAALAADGPPYLEDSILIRMSQITAAFDA